MDATTKENSDNFFKKGGYTMLSEIEEEFDCAGICYKPLFYLTKDISSGPVSLSCDKAIIQEFSGNMAGAAVAFLGALSLLIAMIGAFPLFTGFNKDE